MENYNIDNDLKKLIKIMKNEFAFVQVMENATKH